RVVAITVLFVVGAALIYLCAEPFLGGLLSLSVLVGIPAFIFLQWMAPVVSEFPEMASTFYWARTVQRAPIALMNIVSSNINQWSLLPALLPIILSISARQVTAIAFDDGQKAELLLTVAQASIGLVFLINMELAWWEAVVLFTLFWIPFVSRSFD